MQLNVRAYIRERSCGWTSAVVVTNPFYRSKKLPKELLEDKDPVFRETGTELLICDLDDCSRLTRP